MKVGKVADEDEVAGKDEVAGEGEGEVRISWLSSVGARGRTNKKRVGAHHELSNRRSQLQVAARRTDAFDLQSGRVVIALGRTVAELVFCLNFRAIAERRKVDFVSSNLYNPCISKRNLGT